MAEYEEEYGLGLQASWLQCSSSIIVVVIVGVDHDDDDDIDVKIVYDNDDEDTHYASFRMPLF